MPKILVRDHEGGEHEVIAKAGMTLMEAIRWAPLPLRSSCGGSCACGTCHVLLDEQGIAKVGAAGDEERDLLNDDPAATPTSRLACQIAIDERVENLRVMLLDPWR